ncbi:MAG: NUDIX domain-containing protein [Ruminococcaceae bacterium]|nr:NUDIX domain-containing protein [Oscillospiraceae bacterium]
MGYIEELRKIIGHRCISLTGSVVIITDTDGRILLQKRTHPKGRWGLPGGLMELGESCEETAVREVREETSLEVRNLELFGVYSGKDYFCTGETGDEWYVIVIAYTCKDFSGQPKISDGESEELRWFLPSEIPESLANSHRQIILDYVKKQTE